MADDTRPDPSTHGNQAVSRDGNATDRALYGDLPATTEMFPAHVALRDTVRQRDADVADGLGLDTAARQARNREFVALAATGLDPSVIAPLYHAVTDAELAAKRGRAADPAAVHAQEEAGRALRAAGLREYGRAWQRVVRISRQGSRPAPGQPDTGGPLDPQNHRLNPRRLKAALGRSLAAAGIKLQDSHIRGARR
jgi:hypothetical protein